MSFMRQFTVASWCVSRSSLRCSCCPHLEFWYFLSLRRHFWQSLPGCLVLLEEYRVLDSWGDDASTVTSGKISHIFFVLVQLAMLGSTVDMWCVSLRLFSDFRTFYTLRWIRILWWILGLLSIYTQNGKVCTVDASGCSFRSSLARTWKPGHYNYELTYLAMQMMDGFGALLAPVGVGEQCTGTAPM